MKKKRNYLLEKMRQLFINEQCGKVLDLGCGDGDYSKMLLDLGFDVVACDLDERRFKYAKDGIKFVRQDVTEKLTFKDSSFDYVLFLEVIEHLTNPYSVMREISRVLKTGGILFISTPNILNLKSRMRFLFEGAFQYFREPPFDQVNNPKEKIFNLHIFPYRFQELEYLLWKNGFIVDKIFTSVYEGFDLSFLVPLIWLQLYLKQRRSVKKGALDYSRINRILLSKELLFGRHMIVRCVKQ